MKKTRIQILEELKETKFEVGDYISLNVEVQENKLQAFNIDDNGIAMIDEDLRELNESEYNKVAGEVTYAGDKEEVNSTMGMEVFYWKNIDFLNDWRKKYGYEEVAMTQEGIDEFVKIIDEEINKEKDGINQNIRKEEAIRNYIFTDQYGGRVTKESLIDSEKDLILETIGLESNTYASSFIDDDRVRDEAISEMEDRVNSAKLPELEEWAKDNVNFEALYEGLE